MLAGYCTPRHALVVAWVLTLAGGAGLGQLATLAGRLAQKAKRIRWPAGRVEAAVLGTALVILAAVSASSLTAPIDSGFAGYREAGEWLRANASAHERVIDPKGLALFLCE